MERNGGGESAQSGEEYNDDKKAGEQREEEDGKFSCNLCGSRLGTKQGLGIHLKRVHGPACTAEAKFFCGVCKKSFREKFRLNAHMKVHTIGPFICYSCGNKYSHKCNIVKHTKTCCSYKTVFLNTILFIYNKQKFKKLLKWVNIIRFAVYLYKTVKTVFKILITLFADKINSIN